MTNPNKIILGLLGAAAVGVAIGLILAPEKSSEIRQKIADKASDIASRIGEMITSGKEHIMEAGENVANKAKHFASDVSSGTNTVKNNMA